MENLLSSTLSHSTLPEHFVFPADQRPPASTRTVSPRHRPLPRPRRDLPTISLLNRPGRRVVMQVVNHGVSAEAIRDMEAVCESSSAAGGGQGALYSEDTGKSNRLFSSTTEVVEKFVEPTRGVGMELLRLLCEGMGLRPDY
ncbi:hypothetical protein QYE76_042692 [Lolium multiflorum]|uniref:Non-haem dioxygenase N-terminal domain-containing protein n=1 Tax=Lolium multiflorum TaxID=4521 RepID=A0AAD8WVD1_LOLMU|nr:hypothetical protein QYE76_042692 [Lolium multiflorum]